MIKTIMKSHVPHFLTNTLFPPDQEIKHCRQILHCQTALRFDLTAKTTNGGKIKRNKIDISRGLSTPCSSQLGYLQAKEMTFELSKYSLRYAQTINEIWSLLKTDDFRSGQIPSRDY